MRIQMAKQRQQIKELTGDYNQEAAVVNDLNEKETRKIVTWKISRVMPRIFRHNTDLEKQNRKWQLLNTGDIGANYIPY